MNGELPAEQQALLEKVYGAIPHVRDLGMQLVELKPAAATFSLPYRKELLGDSLRGLIHTSVVSSMIDSVSGLSVLAALTQLVRIATLDLRVDYLRPAVADKTLFASAECFRLTRHIAFVRASVYQDGPENVVATGASTFMLQSRSNKVLR